MSFEELLKLSNLQEFYENLKSTTIENETKAKENIKAELLSTFGKEKYDELLEKKTLEDLL